MRAAIYNEFNGDIQIEDVAIPPVPADGVLVEVGASGICRSDWRGWRGFEKQIRLPHVPGHEFAGSVAEVGADVKHWKTGDRVTVPFVNGCGQCEWCTTGRAQVCPRQTQPGFTHWGSFAEYVVVHNADFNLVSIPAGLEFVTAASMGCRFATAYSALALRGQLSAGQSLVVIGCGGVGLSAVAIANALDAEVIAVDVNPDKLDFASRLGASHTINLAEEEYSPEAVQILLDEGAHITLDAIGKPEWLEQCVRSLRPRGVHVQVGLQEGELSSLPINDLTARELSVLASHGMAAADYPKMFELIASGACDPKQLVTGVLSLEQSPRILMSLDERPALGMAVIDMEMG